MSGERDMSDLVPPSTPAGPPASRRRLLAVAVVVLIPVIPIVIGLLLGDGASRATVGAATTSSAALAPVAPARAHGVRTALAPPGRGAIVGLVRHATAMRASPGGRVLATLRTTTPFRSPTFVLVARRRGPWLGVIVTAAGNHRIGWIPGSAVSLGRVDWALHAFLARHELVVYHDGRAVRRFTIAVGTPDAPTPPGRYEVTDRLRTGDPAGPYGCCILALSATAPHRISGWDGGNRIAIHSTPESSSIGQSVSHGCLRLTLADGRWLIDHVPLGTPTVISSA